MVELPFTFRYYGREYDRVTVCTNGFLMMGTDEHFVPNQDNWSLDQGGVGATYGIVAPFWDNLQVLHQEDRADISTAFDDMEHAFIVEWHRVRFVGAQNTVSFQVLLFDPDFHPTPSGDGAILFQYDDITQREGNPVLQTPYATVGITAPDGRSGITYSAAGQYHPGAARLENDRAILFTTAPCDMRASVGGVVTNALNHQPVANVLVSTTAHRTTTTDPQGRWTMDDVWARMPLGLTFSKEGYNTRCVENIVLDEGEQREIDIQLTHPEFALNHGSVGAWVQPDMEVERRLAISNPGDGALEWSAVCRLRDVDNPEPWTPVARLDIPDLGGCIEGIAFAGDTLVAAVSRENAENLVYVLSRRGEVVRSFAQPGDSPVGMWDVTYDGTEFWGVVDGEAFSFTTDGEFTARFGTPIDTVQAITWDTDREVLWMSGLGGGIFGYDRQGEQRAVLSSGNLVIHGLAYWGGDPDERPLYVLHSPDHGRQVVVKLDPVTGASERVVELTPEGGGRPKSACITDEWDANGWVFMTLSGSEEVDRVDIYQVADATDWFSVRPVAGRIEPGGCDTLIVTFDSAGLPLGEYAGRLIFGHNAEGRETVINVDLVVALSAPDGPASAPFEFGIRSISPNPFNAAAAVSFSVDRAEATSLAVYDLRGRRIRMLYEGVPTVGVHTFAWDSRGLPSGIYFLKLESASGRFETAKAVILR